MAHRSKKKQHFLAYTIEHILGAFFVFAVAMFLGYGAYAADTSVVSTTSLSTTIPGAYILPPPVLSVMNVVPGKVELSWAGVLIGSSAQGFAVYRNDKNISNLTVPSYTDATGIIPGATYVYYVKTIDTAGNASAQSNIVTVTIPVSSSSVSSATTVTTSTVVSTSTSSGVSTPTPPANPPTVPSTATQPAVSFGVTVAPITDCSNGKPMTEVFFVVSDPLGGAFELSSDGGIKNAPLEWGRYPFTNGTYSWKAIAKAGYTISGNITGSFSLAGTCAVAATATAITVTSVVGTFGTPTASADAFPLKYPQNVNIVPVVSIDSVHVKEGDVVSGIVTLDVVAKGSTRSVFVLESKAGTKQFIDKQLGVVHKDGTDEWSVLWNTTNMNNDDYNLSVLMDTSAGTIISKKFAFTVNNSPLPSSSQSGAATIKKPILKMYLSNSALLSGATVAQGEQVELRVGATGAKKVNFYAIVPTAGSPIDIGQGVIDDLLSGKTQDIWTVTFDTNKIKEGSYKVFARVLSLDGTVTESVPLPITVANTSNITASPVSSASDTNTLLPLTLDERKEILARVTDPSECTTKDECKVFCDIHGSLPECLAYVRTVLAEGDRLMSLASNISTENLTRVLADTRKRSDIPDLVKNADDLVKFCADPSRVDLCKKMLTKNDLATTETLAAQEVKLRAAKDIEAKKLTERIGARSFIDTDGDGVSDYDEVNIYHTNYNDADTDNDGVPDGAEIVNHTNPHGNEPATETSATTTNATVSSPIDEGVTFEDPLITGVEKKSLLTVSNVQVAEVGTSDEGLTTAKKLILSGTALPNSFVTLYVFSTPIVVTIKADSTGAWVYTLDKELPNGSHQVVSAITDEGGHILAKSETLPFVKVAAAVSVGSNALLPSNETPGFFTGASLYAFIAILIGLIGVAFSIIGFAVRTRTEKEGPLFPPTAK